MRKSAEKDVDDDIYAEAASWEADKALSRQKSEQRAWRTVYVLAAVTIVSMCVSAVVLLRPPPLPPIIRVDNSTGIVDVVKTITNGKATYDEAINKYFVAKYVMAREGYTRALAEKMYETVGLMSGVAEAKKYEEHFRPRNPASPLNVYGEFAKVTVYIKGILFIQPKVALVRYSREVRKGSDRPLISNWAATVLFDYVNAPMNEKDREINPLGFQTIEYRNDPDSMVVSEGRRDTPTPQTVRAPAIPEVVLFPGREGAALPLTEKQPD